MALELTLTLSPAIDAAKLNVMINALKASLGPLGDAIKPIDANKLNAELKKVEAESAKAAAEMAKLDDNVKKVGSSAGFMGKAFQFNQITQSVTTVANAFKEVLDVGNEFEATLAAVGAVTGQSGEGLAKLGVAARELAKQFGTSASDNLKSFQGILSKFGPQVAENAEALKKMGATVNLLSAASGDSADVSMAALTDTMLQLGLVTGDAAKDADTMVQVADALAASAKVGAAEIPQVAQSMLQTGVAAKGAKLSLEQTTAAIQVLAVGGKTGSEAGVALRNVLGMLQKQSGPGAAALKGMGTSVEELAQILTTQGLEAALTRLQEGLNTTGSVAERNATMMTLFGTENSAAAGILLDNLGQFGAFTQGISDAVKAGTSGADGAAAQAAARMGTAEAIAARMKAKVEDVFIFLQGTLGSGLSGLLSTVSTIAPTIATISQVKNILPDDALDKLKEYVVTLIAQFIPSLATTSAATAATGVAASGSATGFSAMWAAATGPVGLVIAGIALVVGGLVLLYNNVDSFKDKVDGILDFFVGLWDTVAPIFPALGSIIGEFGGLIFDVAVAPFELMFDVVGEVASAVLGLLSLGGDTTSTMDSVRAAVEFISTALDKVKAGIAGLKAAFGAVKEGLSNTISALASGDVLGAAKAFTGIGDEAGKAFNSAAIASMREARLQDAVETMQESIGDGIKIQAKIDAIDTLPDLAKQLKEIESESSTLQIKVDSGTATEAEKKKLDDLKAKAEQTSKQIADLAPGAIASQKTVVDAAGNLKTVYTVNADAAVKMGEAQKAAFGSDLQKSAKSYSNELIATTKIYAGQKKDLADLKVRAEAAANAGDSKKAKELSDEYKKLSKDVDKTGQQMVDAFAKGGQAGLLTEDAIKAVAKAQGISADEAKKQLLAKALMDASAAGKTTQTDIAKIADKFHVSKEEAQKLLEEQKKQTSEAKNTAQSVGDITKAYTEATAGVKDAFNQGKAEEKALNAELEKLAKNDPRRKRLELEYAAIRKRNRELDAQSDREDARSKAVDEQYENKKKKEESLFKQLKESFDLNGDVLDRAAKIKDIEQENQIVAEERKKTAADELIAQERAVALLKEKLKAASAIGTIDETGTITLNPKIKVEDQGAASKLISDLSLSILSEESKLQAIKLKAKIESIDLAEALRQSDLDALRTKLDAGLIPSDTLVAELKIELDKIKAAYATADDKTKLVLLKNEMSFQKEIDNIRKKDYENALKKLDETAKAEEEKRKADAIAAKQQAEALITTSAATAELLASKKRDEAIAALDALKNDEAISQADYDARKVAAEESFQKQLSALKAREAGNRLNMQNAFDANELEAQKRLLEQKLALATAAGDTSGAAKLQEELTKVVDTLNEKRDEIGTGLELLKTGVSDALGGLFDGDTEAMKNSMRATLSTIVGFLEKLVSATIIRLVLGSEPLVAIASTFGFLSPVILGGFSQLIGAGVRALVNPIFSGITSFATGGVFTKPTLAMVGDGARLGGSNIEYLLRNDQIKALLNEVTARSDAAISAAVRALGEDIRNMVEGFVIRGEDIRIALARASASIENRSRALPT